MGNTKTVAWLVVGLIVIVVTSSILIYTKLSPADSTKSATEEEVKK